MQNFNFFHKKTTLLIVCSALYIFLCCIIYATPTLAIAKSNNNKQEELPFKTSPLVPISKAAATKQTKALDKARMGLKSWTELAPSLQDSLNYSKRWPQNSSAIEHQYIPWSKITASLELLISLLPRLDKEPELLSKHFQWFKLNPSSHFTGYYSPVIKASQTKKPGYTAPIYRLPDELAPELAYCLAKHNCPDTAFTKVIRPDPPFFSREAIDLDNALEGRGLEIAWLEHPFDVYALMLQGSGYLDFDTGTDRAVLFAGFNGHRGESMAGYLMRTKNVHKRDATIEGMRAWWDKNPSKRRAFLQASAGYVFFRYGPSEPQATIGGKLVPWVSLAVDARVLPLGGILAYALPTKGTAKAGVITSGNNSMLNGLGLAQDTGGAINLLRIDLYAGKGAKAHDKAMSVYNKGQIWLLLKR